MTEMPGVSALNSADGMPRVRATAVAMRMKSCDGASVARTERDPGERAVVAASPLREQGPLAEADRRRQCDHSAIRCGDQLIDQRRAVDETGPIRRHVKLVLDESPTDLIVCTRAHLVRPPGTHTRAATYVAVPASLPHAHSTLPHGAERTGG